MIAQKDVRACRRVQRILASPAKGDVIARQQSDLVILAPPGICRLGPGQISG